jgi:hypothetical protein
MRILARKSGHHLVAPGRRTVGLRAANSNEPLNSPAPRPRWQALGWLPFVILAIVAIAYIVVPSRAAGEPCSAWTTVMLEDEGGAVLTASVCADADTWLYLTCHEGTVGIRYDLAAGSAVEPALDSTAQVTFTTAAADVRLEMTYQAMDGIFAADTSADGPLIQLLTAEADVAADVTIFDEDHFFVERMLSLEGAQDAVAELLAAC